MDSGASSMQTLYPSYRTTSSRNKLILIAVAVGAVGLTLGVLIGYFGRRVPEGPCLGPGVPESLIEDGDPTIAQKIIDQISADNIKNNLREWTRVPHLAGTEADLDTANKLRDIWRQQGLDPVHVTGYDVLLSKPDDAEPSQIHLLDKNDNKQFSSAITEEPLQPEQNRSDVVPPFNAYSAPGNVTGSLVYVNYARIEDFIYLRDNLTLNLTGTIAIARYGKIYRGDKASHAEQYGCVGLILYSDPYDYAVDGVSKVYPESWWLPPTGVQRGTIYAGDGDPLTPGYPSVDTAFRIAESEASLPKIPVHPIGYGDAKVLLSHIGGDEVPESWRGSLNVTYRFGGNNTQPMVPDGWKVRMEISTRNQVNRTYNVIGYLKGEVEPDRYVLLGNHRDAWVFGAADPTSGTATMIELSRVLAKLYKEGWRPRRTIVFCSWGAEEYALIGSYEWVEHFQKVLGERAVAYLNVDIAVRGNYSLRGGGVPIMYDAFYNAARKVPSPRPEEVAAGRPTMYDTWLHSFPVKDSEGSVNRPRIGTLGAGSDYAGFLQRLGIPSIDATYLYNTNDWHISSYPLYHSGYETFHLMDVFIDPGFTIHRAMGQLWGELARSLADSLVLPLKVSRYPVALREFTNDLERGYGHLFQTQNISLDDLDSAVTDFQKECEDFERRLREVKRNNPMATRLMNDQMIQLERAFTDPAGVPGRVLYKHLIYAPSQHDAYAGASFPGLVDPLFEIEKATDSELRWQAVKQHLSVLVFTIRAAAATLQDPLNFGEYGREN